MPLDEQRIREAVEKAKELGWTIYDLLTRNDATKRCCPLGAVGLLAGSTSCNLYAIARELGLSVNEVGSFADGFDGEANTTFGDSAAYRLGAKFRRELLPEGDRGK